MPNGMGSWMRSQVANREVDHTLPSDNEVGAIIDVRHHSSEMAFDTSW